MLHEPSPEAIAAAVRAAVGGGWKQLADSRGYCSSVARIECQGTRLVVKASAGRRLGLVWRYLLRREARAYRHLEGVEGVPRCFGLVDGRYLVLEEMQGAPFREAVLEGDDAFFRDLLELMQRLHERGVAHGDLKKKENLLVAPDGRPIALDFATAVVRKPGRRPLNRFLYRTLEQFDYNAWLKHKYRRDLSRISAEDARYYRQTPVERLNTVLVHRLLPRSRPRYRQTVAGRNRGPQTRSVAGRFRDWLRERRAWKAALRAAPIASGSGIHLRTVGGSVVAFGDDGILLALDDPARAVELVLFSAGREGVPICYGDRVAVHLAAGGVVALGASGELRVAQEEAEEFVVFDPTSRFQEGEPLRPGLPLSLATPDQQRRWLHDPAAGETLVASKRYLRRSSTFFAASATPSA